MTVNNNETLVKINVGLFIRYENIERSWLGKWKEDPTKNYSDVFETDLLPNNKNRIAFISTEKDTITYISKYKKDKIVATGKTRLIFTNTYKLQTPLKKETFLDIDSELETKSFGNMFDANSIYTINAYQWNKIVFTLKNINSSDHEKLGTFLFIDSVIDHMNQAKTDTVVEERDALGLILRLSSLDKRLSDIEDWNIVEDSTPDFLKNVTSQNLLEDQMIINDMNCFGDWDKIKDYKNNTCTFSDNEKRVTVMNVNRTNVEHNIGVDILYYNHKYKSYIFVQYKRLKQESKRFRYRPTQDKNYKKEIDLMDRFESVIKLNGINDDQDFKLNDEPFYFKFCKERQEIQTKELCSGFYITKEHLKLVEQIQRQANTSVIFSYETVDKYLTNTMFIDLVQSGLIGTQISSQTIISKLIQEILTSKKSLILAA